jgi:hypothetical protein
MSRKQNKIPSFLTLLIIFSMFFKTSYAQLDLLKITPLSPNAAEFSKYITQPVNNFTGIPDISIPLYSIRSGELELPLGLSYHAGGNKVESIASWVGLSWSLNSLPIISRTVNGIPDELAGGYNTVDNGFNLKQLYDHMTSTGATADFYQFLINARHGLADTEPDVYSFNINGKSGKFYYNQNLRKFVCTPISNISISFDGGFKIINDDGTQYYFQDIETSQSQASGPSQPVTTSWQISKISDATNRDIITFGYNIEVTTTRTFSFASKYQFISGNPCADVTPPDDPGI